MRLFAVLPFTHSIQHTVCGGCNGVGSGPNRAEGIGRRHHSTTHSLGGAAKSAIRESGRYIIKKNLFFSSYFGRCVLGDWIYTMNAVRFSLWNSLNVLDILHSYALHCARFRRTLFFFTFPRVSLAGSVTDASVGRISRISCEGLFALMRVFTLHCPNDAQHFFGWEKSWCVRLGDFFRSF